MFARTYAPSQVPKAVKAWKHSLVSKRKGKQAAALSDPSAQPDEFTEGFEEALAREQQGRAAPLQSEGNLPLIDANGDGDAMFGGEVETEQHAAFDAGEEPAYDAPGSDAYDSFAHQEQGHLVNGFSHTPGQTNGINAHRQCFVLAISMLYLTLFDCRA